MGSRQKLSTSRGPRCLIGWSLLGADESPQDRFNSLKKLKRNGFCTDLETLFRCCSISAADKRQSIFDRFIHTFLKEICSSTSFRPLPPMLGNGKCVDLFKLFSTVKEKGGFDAVSGNGLWDSVAKDSGLGSGVASAAKLIYVKYLDSFARWSNRILEDKSDIGGIKGCQGDLGGLLMELEPEFEGFLSEFSDEKQVDENYSPVGLKNCQLNTSDVQNFIDLDEVVDNDEDLIILDLHPSLSKEGSVSRKRKRECLTRMMNWVSQMAKDPCDPAIGLVPERAQWKLSAGDELWKQVLLTRKALLANVQIDRSVVKSIWQKKKYTMHPSMYDDNIGSDPLSAERLTTEKSRYSQRIVSAKKPHSQSCSDSSSSCTQNDINTTSNACKEEKPNTHSSNLISGFYGCDHIRKRIPIGQSFQAKVPQWTGMPSECDSKWLGTTFWPLKNREKSILIERDRIGMGRQDSCGCQFPGSVECVKFHISEKRAKVKLELGSAFYYWKFDRMGEEVGVSWTLEEEKKFEATVRQNPPSMDKCFWDEIFKIFPTKRSADLVRYYYNVFLLRLRGYQNRFTPHNVDSDDEESEFGPIRNCFGREAYKSPGSIFYSPSKQHMKST